jgi:DNA-directed RNA polymerase subunit RPC12/RpoP
MNIKCTHCGSTKLKAIDNEPLDFNNETFDNELYVKFDCNNCGKECTKVFDLKPQHKKFDELVDRVLYHIEKDFRDKDLTAVDDLLKYCPIKNLVAYLPEEEWAEFKHLLL